MKLDKLSLFDHYWRLLFYSFYRFKGSNYQLMREYFAQILIMEIDEFMPLWNKKVLDVGEAILCDKRKCDATNLEPYPGKDVWHKTKIVFADNMPFNDDEFDLVICRGVLEHIPIEKQQQSVNCHKEEEL